MQLPGGTLAWHVRGPGFYTQYHEENKQELTGRWWQKRVMADLGRHAFHLLLGQCLPHFIGILLKVPHDGSVCSRPPSQNYSPP